MTSAWLIERHIGNDLNYWSPGARGRGGLHDWSLDIEFAVRFAREQDATMALYYACDRQGRVAQHRWVDNPAIVTETTRRVTDERFKHSLKVADECFSAVPTDQIPEHLAMALDLRDALARATAAEAEVERLKEANEHWHDRVRTGDLSTRKCAALMGFDPPQDCDAPFCGCNPAWTKAIEMLQECGWVDRSEICAAESREAALVARVKVLEAALRAAINVASEAADEWDRDNDPRVGKLLIALAGGIPGYRKDIDNIHAALPPAASDEGR